MANREYIENPSIIKKAKRSIMTRQIQLKLDKERHTAQTEYDEDKQELGRLGFRAETIDEHAQNAKALQEQLAQMQTDHHNLKPFLY